MICGRPCRMDGSGLTRSGRCRSDPLVSSRVNCKTTVIMSWYEEFYRRRVPLGYDRPAERYSSTAHHGPCFDRREVCTWYSSWYDRRLGKRSWAVIIFVARSGAGTYKVHKWRCRRLLIGRFLGRYLVVVGNGASGWSTPSSTLRHYCF
jgi:hypothetical protein